LMVWDRKSTIDIPSKYTVERNLNRWSKKPLTYIAKCRAHTRPSPPLFPGPTTTSTLLVDIGG
jgi:hypothetical protein